MNRFSWDFELKQKDESDSYFSIQTAEKIRGSTNAKEWNWRFLPNCSHWQPRTSFTPLRFVLVLPSISVVPRFFYKTHILARGIRQETLSGFGQILMMSIYTWSQARRGCQPYVSTRTMSSTRAVEPSSDVQTFPWVWSSRRLEWERAFVVVVMVLGTCHIPSRTCCKGRLGTRGWPLHFISTWNPPQNMLSVT